MSYAGMIAKMGAERFIRGGLIEFTKKQQSLRAGQGGIGGILGDGEEMEGY